MSRNLWLTSPSVSSSRVTHRSPCASISVTNISKGPSSLYVTDSYSSQKSPTTVLRSPCTSTARKTTSSQTGSRSEKAYTRQYDTLLSPQPSYSASTVKSPRTPSQTSSTKTPTMKSTVSSKAVTSKPKTMAVVGVQRSSSSLKPSVTSVNRSNIVSPKVTVEKSMNVTEKVVYQGGVVSKEITKSEKIKVTGGNPNALNWY